MKKIFILASVIFFAHSVFAKESLRTLDSIEFENGEVKNIGLIADVDGRVFLEFNENVIAVIYEGKTKFTGEVMPPEIIALPNRSPRARMREIFTFELLADTSDAISFADKLDLLNERNRIRLLYNSPDDFIRTAAVKLLAPINEEFGVLALWQYLPEEEQWKRLGGTTSDTSLEDVSVFSAIIWGTGIYSLFDENPSPTFSPTFPIDEIEMVEESPFSSVETGIPNDDILDDYVEESILPDASATEDDLFDDDSIYTTDDEYEIPALIPLVTATEIPAINPLETVPNIATPSVENFPTVAEKPEEFSPPLDSELTKSGPENTQEKSSKMPIVIFFTMAIVGLSIYFSVRTSI